jgi:hypothetical protein
VKVCVACGKNLPDAAILCVFCRARQHEERLDPTPVRGIRHDRSPSENLRALEEGSAPKPAAPRAAEARPAEARPAEPRPAEPRPAEPRPSGNGVSKSAAAPVEAPKPVAERDDRSVLIQLSQWNRNERTTLAIAGVATLVSVLAYAQTRTALPIILALAIVAAGVAPLPRAARGALSLVAGLALLLKLFGPAAAGGLAILPGALLTRAKNPASRLAQLWGLVAAAALVAAFLVPRGDQTLARTILDGFKSDLFVVIAESIWLTLAIPLAVVGLLALTPRKTFGGCVFWATVMLLWLPVGLLLFGFWSIAILPSLTAALLMLGASTAAALGLADVSS